MSEPRFTDESPLNQFRVDGRVAFLSGATGHLGRVLAEVLAVAGAHVVLNARHEDALHVLATDLKGKGCKVSTACFDVADEKAVAQHIARIGEAHGRLDIVVNNASGGRPGTIETASADDFDLLYRVNVVGPFHILRTALPLLKHSGQLTAGGASVVNVSSMYGTVSPDPSIYGTSGANNPPYYGAAKAGMIQLTKYAACHLAADKVRVNSLSPGPFPARTYLDRDPEFHTQLKRKTPMGRTGDPSELAGPLLFLVSDASSFVTGINLAVDGGWTAW